jgi:hypothetical protein
MRDFCLFLLLTLAAAGGIVRYQTSTRQVRVDEIRKSLAVHAAQVNLALLSGQLTNTGQLDAELERVRNGSKRRIAWIQIRDENGAVRSRAGMQARASFPLKYVQAQLRKRRPVFAVVQTQVGPVLLEVFPVQLPAVSRDTRFATVSGGRQRFGMVEIAAHMDSGTQAVITLQPDLEAQPLI